MNTYIGARDFLDSSPVGSYSMTIIYCNKLNQTFKKKELRKIIANPFLSKFEAIFAYNTSDLSTNPLEQYE